MNTSELVEIEVSQTDFPLLSFKLSSPVPANSLLRIKASGTSMLSGLYIEKVSIQNGDILPFEHRYSRKEMEVEWGWHIRAMSMVMLRVQTEIPANSVLKVQTCYSSHRDPYKLSKAINRYSGLSWWMDIGIIEEPKSTALEPISPPLEIRFVPGGAHRLEAYLKPDRSLLIEHFDSHGNPAKYAGEIKIGMGDEKLAVSCSGETTAESIQLLDSASQVSRIHVRDSHGREALSNAHPIALDGTPIFFGECHWHTNFSGDGQRSMEDALKSARDELGLDFAGPADHMGHNGKYGKNTPAEQASICKDFDSPGRFCTIPGAELSKRYGHANLYTDSFDLFLEITSRFQNELAPVWGKDPNRYGLKALVDLCTSGRSLVIPHHTNMDSYVREHVVHKDGRPFWCAMNWPIPADRDIVRLFEMVQTRGCFEAEETDPDWWIRDGGLGGSARTALMRGYRLGFVGGTDNHCGWPTRKGSRYTGLTAVQSKNLDTKSIFDTMYHRRCYATSGTRIVADVTLNGHPMGSELKLEPGEDRLFRIQIKGTAPIVSVQIIHYGYVLSDLPVGKDQLDFYAEWADERPGRSLEDLYYYVRARQADGHCVWLSPFWVDLPE